MNMKPILYLDVDGVLFAYYDGYSQLRPGVVSFLRWCLGVGLEVHWLTCWPRERLAGLFQHLHAAFVFEQTLYQKWGDGENQWKTSGLDLSREFFWIEDGISPEEYAWLEHNGCADCYYDIRAYGEKALIGARIWLKKQLQQRNRVKGENQCVA